MEQVFPIDRQLGVCEECDDIVAIEYLPDPEVVEQAKGIRQKYDDHLFGDILKRTKQST